MAEQPALGFGGLLRQLRAEARLTQEELAEAAGLSHRSVSDLERGVNRTARKETAELLAGAFGLAGTMSELFVSAARGRTPAAEALAAIRQATAEDMALAPDRSSMWEGCPYLGLMPFEERDAKVFYGRGDLVSQLLRRLEEQLSQPGILLVTGESGAGKSSLLRAGLMPLLAAGALVPGSERWPHRVMRPTGQPLRELAKELADVANADPGSVYRSLAAVPGETATLVELAVRTATGHGTSTARDAPTDSVAVVPRLVLVVDQFEELFTAGEDTDASRVEREAFITALHAAATKPAGSHKVPSALVIAAVRADYLGRFIAYPPWKDALDAGPFTVVAMSESELRLAVTGPAAEADLIVEPAVVDAVIAELREGARGGLGSGVLPLISQAMASAWENREGNKLTLRAYRRVGGVADAVNRSAQTAYDSLTSEQQDAARLVFTQLTIITPDGQFERYRCSRADLYSPGVSAVDDINAVIDAFSAHRLLILGENSVEISHDILLHTWKQLRDWFSDDQVDRALYSQVITDTQTWDMNGRDPSYLYRPGRLTAVDAATDRWQKAPNRYPPLPPTSKAFLSAAHHAARRSIRRRRGGIAILALMTVVALVASSVAFYQRAAAVRQRDQVIYNQVIAEALQSGSSDTSLAAQLNLAAYRIHPDQDVASRLLNTENSPLSSALAANAGSVNSVAFSSDRHTLASGNADGTVRLWDVSDPTRPHPLGRPLVSGPGDIISVAFSPDGRMLASSNLNGTVQLWNIADPTHPRLLGQALTGTSDTAVSSVQVSPDGHTLASSSYDGTIRLWDISDLTRPRPLGPSLTSTTAVLSIAFSPDGHTLAAGDNDGTVRLWDVSQPASPRPIGPGLTGGGAVASMAFSPDGRTLASAGLDGAIYLWDVADPAHPSALGQRLTGGTGAVDSVAFSRDGHTLASGNLDGIIRIWSLPRTVLTGSTTSFNSVAFSADGHTLASTNSGRAIQLWDTAEPAYPRPLGQSLTSAISDVDSVAFSPNRQTLATGSDTGTIQLWDITEPAHPRPLGPILIGTGIYVSSIAFSPDGHTLVSGNSDDSVRLWDVSEPAHPRPLGPILSGGTADAESVTFSPSGHVLAIVGDAGTIRLWNVADPAEPQPGGVALLKDDSVESLAFSPDGHTLASGSYGGMIQLWDISHPAYIRQLTPPLAGGGARVKGVAFSPDGRTLASAGFDGMVRLWNVAQPAEPRPLGQLMTNSTAPVDSVAFSPDGNMLASGSDDGTTRLWDLNVQYAINRICATAGGLTPRQWNTYIPELRYQSTCDHPA